jgi:hypothetical protein
LITLVTSRFNERMQLASIPPHAELISCHAVEAQAYGAFWELTIILRLTTGFSLSFESYSRWIEFQSFNLEVGVRQGEKKEACEGRAPRKAR